MLPSAVSEGAGKEDYNGGKGREEAPIENWRIARVDSQVVVPGFERARGCQRNEP